MFGISSSWKSPEISDGNRLIDEIEKTGIPGIELEYRLSRDTFGQIKNRLKNDSLKVLSLHNYCPHPNILPIDKASGDAFWLSSIDEAERKLAVQYSLRTIRNASELGVNAVVLHLGKVSIEREKHRWFELYDNGKFQDKEGKEFFNQKLKEREQEKKPYFDALLKSVEELNIEAEKLNIWLGAENRFHWDQFPNFEEIGIILDYFKGGKIGYWHDVGHAQAQETFGLGKHEKFLKTYSKHLIGIHLHDSQQIGYNDHFAPGSGMIDFDMIRKYLPESAIRIIEVHPKVSFNELQRGVQFLKEKNIIR
jgi:sugar phosphate isomerase/epimerase